MKLKYYMLLESNLSEDFSDFHQLSQIMKENEKISMKLRMRNIRSKMKLPMLSNNIMSNFTPNIKKVADRKKLFILPNQFLK